MKVPLRLSRRPPVKSSPRVRNSGQRLHTLGLPRAQLRQVPQLAPKISTTWSPLFEIPYAGADLSDDPRAFMAEHRRQGARTAVVAGREGRGAPSRAFGAEP